MNIVGPTRLVLLRAGKYDYGEVELINRKRLIARLHRSEHDLGPVEVPGEQGLVVGE